MRIAKFLALAALAMLPSVLAPAVSGARDGELSLRVRAGSAKGPIPPKTARGETDALGIVAEAAGETEFRTIAELADAVTSGQESGPNGEIGLRVMAVPGRGGLQNIRDVLTRPGIDFGIAPALVLERAASTPEMANLRDRIAYVAPLYVEEVHLLAGPGIKAIGDLAGKRVSVGEDGGSTESVANAILDALGVKVEAVNTSPRQAAAEVASGAVDAAFVVSGKPVDALAGVRGGGKVHLVPIPAERIPDGFLPSLLTHADYPNLVPEGTRVETLGVQNVLFGYDWPARSRRGQVGRTFLSLTMFRLPDLQVGQHHPKWREVNVAATMLGWRRLPTMQDWLTRSRPRALGAATEAEFEAFLRRTGTKATGGNRDALYQDFLRWRSSPVSVGTR